MLPMLVRLVGLGVFKMRLIAVVAAVILLCSTSYA
jgi:hypothetical protein